VSDVQFYLSVAVGPALTMVVVLIGVLLNNNRISDMRSEMSARFGDMNTRFGDMRSLIEAHAAAQDANLRRVEEMLLGKFAELDNRLNRIEAHLNLR
jgi:hypothetical protein